MLIQSTCEYWQRGLVDRICSVFYLQYKYRHPMNVCKNFCDHSVICDCLVKGLCNYGESSMKIW